MASLPVLSRDVGNRTSLVFQPVMVMSKDAMLTAMRYLLLLEWIDGRRRGREGM
jgi:hypothetical protein